MTLEMRRLLVVAAVAALVVTVAPSAQATSDDYGTVRNILPPGQSGTVNAAALAQVLAGDPTGRVAVEGRNAPPNFANQLEMYDGFNRLDPAKITEADVNRHYKSAGIEVALEDVARVERPKAGVTITWDRFGVAHVKGVTDADVAWGAGYAGTRDRMFLQDVLRHAGAARIAEFLGPSPENIASDAEQLRAAYYTPAEAAAQLQHAADNAGELGPFVLAAGDAYLAGINAAQDKMCPLGLPTGVDCPAEYVALTRTPRRWTRADLAYIGSLVGGIFGKGGGREVANAFWLQRLQKKYGDAEGRKVYDDLRSKDDSEASTTIAQRFEYGEPAAGVDPTRSGVALPDLAPAATAPGTGSQLGSGSVLGTDPLASGPRRPQSGRLRTPFGTIDLRGVLGMSNAALVDAKHSASGKPLAVFGPQTGYFTPQLLSEISLDGPRIKARGVAFAGTGIFVQIGRGLDYAWSATSLGADNVDTVVERLCNPDGSPATVESVHYRRGAACVPMTRNEHVETALPTVVAPGEPKTIRFLVLRTHHGIVQARTTVDGAPVAVVTQRSTYGRELDSLSGFARFNMPEFVPDPAAFQRAAGEIDFTFNWIYADSRDIALYSSGRLPQRPSTVDVDLPRWGDAAHDWQGWLPFEAHPQVVNPESGVITNWNNKPAPGFTLGDDNWGDGPVHRQRPL
ncbi:MAG TPA: penicillin acylase family protein, partial [Cryptosporangiaceae bacterium]|nr:penicillin acylase family protein [Cryptosporangiaceae bacterium]